MNRVILSGRLTKEPDVRYSAGEKKTAVANFSIAVNRRFKREGQPDADFFNGTVFGKTAEFMEKYCQKGMKIVVSGQLQNDTYEKDGQKHTVTKIMAEEVEIAESKSSSNKTDADGFINTPNGISDELPFL